MDISRLFRSKTRKALFRIYFTNPESRYYLRELERLLDIPVSMIRKELIQLEKEAVFASSKKGNLVYYSLNKAYPLFEELKSIVFKTIGIHALIEDALRKIDGINAAFIYGSFAKSDENAMSDIDLLVIGKPDEDKLIRQMNSIEKAIKREVNYTLYAKEEFKKRKREKDSFILDLLANKRILLIGDKNDL